MRALSRAFPRVAVLAAVLGAVMCCGNAAWAQAAEPEGRAPLTLTGDGPYHRLNLPPALYGRVHEGDLSRLRIHNAQGQAVPWAWLEREAGASHTTSAELPLYAWPGTQGASSSTATAVFALDGQGRLKLQAPPTAGAAGAAVPPRGWLIDLREVRGALLQMRVAPDAQAQGFFPFTLQASDDLQHWRAVGGEEQLLRLQSPVQSGSASTAEPTTLERLTVDLQGVQARFLRLQWRDPARAPRLQRVQVDSVQQLQPVLAPQWSGPIQPEQCAQDHCDYRMPANLPLASLRIHLAQANTLAPVTVAGLRDPATSSASTSAGAAQRPVGHVHNPLYALRRYAQRPPPPSTVPNEWPLFDTVVYRIAQPDGEARSPDMAMEGADWTRLRLRTRGPVSALGTPPPTLEVASLPRTLVFLAQGTAPFELRWPQTPPQPSTASASGAPLPLATLMPGRDLSQPLATGEALVQVAPRALDASASAAPSVAVNAQDAAQAQRKYWLWGALALGLLLLAGMAASLLRSVGKAAKDER